MPKYLSAIENDQGLTQEAQFLLSQFTRNSYAKHRPAYTNNSKLMLPTRNQTSAPAARRSGRQRTGPINYYERINLFAERDSDDNVSERSRNSSAAYRLQGSHSSSPDLRPEPPRSSQYSRIDDSRPRHRLQTHNPPSCRTSRNSRTLNRLLYGRELGNTSRQLQAGFAQDLKPSKYWQGASNDVIVLVWSPDGTRFAAGATAQSDELNMEYNRGNNLVLGDLTRNSIKELPDHWVKCPWRRAASGQNQTDTRLSMSVTSMQWFDDILFTASYDNTVKLWDVSTHANAGCVGTLRHDSKVQVMARSNFDSDMLATGTDSIGLWNIKGQNHTPLEFQQRQRKKEIELVSTSLAWGTTSTTRNILLAGMSEKDEGIPQNGLLAAWRIDEASTTPIHLSPNAQNIFDIKWHPSLPCFLTGSAATPSRASMARSVVRIYEPLTSKMHSMELDCPALDINDVTFCPTNPYYVTASCTDGITYVWDCRNPKDILLRLGHGGPSEQIDESLPRERVDVGIRTALWGGGPDQFYSGASDAVLKRWNILRSQEDAHVDDVARFPGAVMCGAFSSDKTNLLIGESAGGLHVLSSSPFQASDDQGMAFECATEAIHDNGGDQQVGFNPEAQIANNMLLGGELVRHPIYGVGKGPHYKGPFASWARPGSTPRHLFAETPLREEILVRQLDGAPLNNRQGLDEQTRREIASRIQFSRIRNQRRHENKRKRDGSISSTKPIPSSNNNFIDLCSIEETDDEIPPPPRPIGKSKKRAGKAVGRVITKAEPEIIDLTLESDPKENATAGQFTFGTLLEELEEDIEEDFWWPASGTIDPNFPKEGEEDP